MFCCSATKNATATTAVCNSSRAWGLACLRSTAAQHVSSAACHHTWRTGNGEKIQASQTPAIIFLRGGQGKQVRATGCRPSLCSPRISAGAGQRAAFLAQRMQRSLVGQRPAARGASAQQASQRYHNAACHALQSFPLPRAATVARHRAPLLTCRSAPNDLDSKLGLDPMLEAAVPRDQRPVNELKQIQEARCKPLPCWCIQYAAIFPFRRAYGFRKRLLHENSSYALLPAQSWLRGPTHASSGCILHFSIALTVF